MGIRCTPIPIPLHDTHSHHTVPRYNIGLAWPQNPERVNIQTRIYRLGSVELPRKTVPSWAVTPISRTHCWNIGRGRSYDLRSVNLKRFTEPSGFFTTLLSTVQPLKTDQVIDLSGWMPRIFRSMHLAHWAALHLTLGKSKYIWLPFLSQDF